MSEAANDNGKTEDVARRRCPICSKPTVPEFRPFCSKRCADVDLHRWLGGRYAVPTDDDADLDDEQQ